MKGEERGTEGGEERGQSQPYEEWAGGRRGRPGRRYCRRHRAEEARAPRRGAGMQDDVAQMLMSSVFTQVTGRWYKWEQEARPPKGTKSSEDTEATGGERVACRGSEGQDDVALIAMSRVLMQVTAGLKQSEEGVRMGRRSGPPLCRPPSGRSRGPLT